MKIKPKGTKIYRRKDRIAYHKKIRQDTGSAVVTLLIAGVLGFVGYSAGKPVIAFLQERNFLAPPSAYHQKTLSAEEVTETSAVPEENFEPESLPTETETIPPTEIETEENLGFVQKAPSIQGYLLNESSLMTEAAFHEALEQLPDGISHLLIPLKTKGGNIWYATSVKDAARSNAVQAFLPLTQIFQEVSAKGIEPVAMLNTLEDSVFPKNSPEASYLIQNSGEVWTDKSTADPVLWLSPFSSLTQDYLSAFAEEIETAGFRTIVCDGLAFPNFPRTDLPSLDPKCSESDRYQYLTELLTAMREKAPESVFFVRVDGNSVRNGDTEAVSAAESFPADCLLVSGSPDTQEELQNLKEISGSVPVILEYPGDTVPENLKLKSYVLHPQE